MQLYSLDSCPLTKKLLDKIDVTQRIMLRRIVGWISYAEDTWEERGSKMKARLNRCLALYPVQVWSEAIQVRKKRLYESWDGWPALTKSACSWHPIDCSPYQLFNAYRAPGRPATRWFHI